MRIAVWHHCVLSGPRIPNEDFAISVLIEQSSALLDSGLVEEADEIHVGINGRDGLLASSILPFACQLHPFPDGQSEIPTLQTLRSWLPGHEGWAVLYHHTKGVSQPDNRKNNSWRDNMERVCIWNWQYCVASLVAGFDSCGAHWLTPEQFGGMVKSPYWGGNFWWATSDFLLTLPPLPEDTHANRYAAESWIGTGPRRPRVKDYLPGWPA